MTDQPTLPGDVNLDFDLDAAERPAEEIKPPFRTKIGGRVVSFDDPGNIDWQDLVLIQSPAGFVDFSLSKEDRAHILAQEMPGWKLNMLMDKYMKHFGLDKRMQQAEREAARRQR